VLVDAPCTSEGAFRIPVPRYAPAGLDGIAALAAVQRRLVTRATALLAPGGLLLYAVCSYAPEEGEAVIQEALDRSADLDVVELDPACPGLPGLVTWQGRRFDPRMRRARRLFPHHTGSWGFFVALLEKKASASMGRITGLEPSSERDDAEARDLLVGFAEERFGVPRETFAPYSVTREGRAVWLLARPASPARDVAIEPLRMHAPGLRALRVQNRGIHATNGLLRLLGPAITRNVLDLGWSEAVDLLRQPVGRVEGRTAGQVVLRSEGQVLGAAFVQQRTLHVQIPKSWRPSAAC
jgi:hypothetical protein